MVKKILAVFTLSVFTVTGAWIYTSHKETKAWQEKALAEMDEHQKDIMEKTMGTNSCAEIPLPPAPAYLMLARVGHRVAPGIVPNYDIVKVNKFGGILVARVRQ